MALTKRQKEILDHVTEYIDENGYAPSFEEIADFFGAEGHGGEEILPAYAHPAGEWDDFLNEDTPPAESSADETAAGEPEAGSIRDLMDRVKSGV